MADHTSKETRQIPRELWPELCTTFTNGNYGRMLSMEIIGDDVGDLPLIESALFAAIDFDSLLKGDAFVISYGGEALMDSHIITTPVEFWEAQDVNGRVISLEIVDLNGQPTILSFD